MALETPAHRQGLNLLHFDHLVDPTVATDTTDARGGVGTVIEVNVVRQAVDLDPRHRFSRGPTGANRFEDNTFPFDLDMAIHTRLGGGNRSVGSL